MDIQIEELQQLIGLQTVRIFILEKKIAELAHLLAEAKLAATPDKEDVEKVSVSE